MGGLDALPGLLEAGPLLGEDEAPVGVLFLHHQGVDLLAQRDFVAGVHVLADRELVLRDDALGLVADVDQDLVLVDAHHEAGDDVAFAEHGQRHVVVGHDLAVDLGQIALALGDDARVLGRRGGRGVDDDRSSRSRRLGCDDGRRRTLGGGCVGLGRGGRLVDRRIGIGRGRRGRIGRVCLDRGRRLVGGRFNDGSLFGGGLGGVGDGRVGDGCVGGVAHVGRVPSFRVRGPKRR